MPEADAFIFTSACQPRAIGAKGHGKHLVAVPQQGVDLGLALQIPQTNAVIKAGSRQTPSIGAESHGSNPALMSLQQNGGRGTAHLP